MKIRVISDLHLDVNYNYPISYDDDIFTVICGDISSDLDELAYWVKTNIKQGVFVAGNHEGYKGKPLQEVYESLSRMFPLTSPVSFLNNSKKTVNGITFVGGTLWTDFNLRNLQAVDMINAVRLVNDYKYCTTLADKKIVPLCPFHTMSMFDSMIDYIDSCKDDNIVVVSHHAPSIKSIDPIYKDSCVNAAFASNLEPFLLIQYPKIKAWLHGHIHKGCDYTVANCRVISNPRGYISYGEGKDFNPNFTVDL